MNCLSRISENIYALSILAKAKHFVKLAFAIQKLQKDECSHSCKARQSRQGGCNFLEFMMEFVQTVVVLYCLCSRERGLHWWKFEGGLVKYRQTHWPILTDASKNFSSFRFKYSGKNTQQVAGQILTDSHCICSGQKF